MNALPVAFEIENLNNKLITWLGLDSIKNKSLKEIAQKLKVEETAVNGIIKITRIV